MFDFEKLAVYHKAKAFHAVANQLITIIQPNKIVKDQLSKVVERLNHFVAFKKPKSGVFKYGI